MTSDAGWSFQELASRLLSELAADELGLWEAIGLVAGSVYWLSESDADDLAVAVIRYLLSSGLADIRQRGEWREAAAAPGTGVVLPLDEANALLEHAEHRHEITIDDSGVPRTHWLSITERGMLATAR